MGKAQVTLVTSDGTEVPVTDAIGIGHDALNTILGAKKASEALYSHLGHGRWTSFLLKTLKEALVEAEEPALSDEEKTAIDGAAKKAQAE